MRCTVCLAAMLALGAACAGEDAPSDAAAPAAGRVTADSIVVVRDTIVAATIDAAGVAEPIQRATLSTRLMGAVTAVSVREGDRVRAGQLLATIDAREIEARRASVAAGIAAAEAVHRDAEAQLARVRALHADSAATRVQLEAAETGFARAVAALGAARAGSAELEALGAYTRLRAPFAGIVTRRFVDVGAFVAPGAPVLTVEDPGRLRIRVTTAPGAARVAAGTKVQGTVEGEPIEAVVEGVVPSAGAVYTVNATVPNADGRHPSGGTATLHLPAGERSSLLVPAAALVSEGDLVGVRVAGSSGTGLRWVRVGARHGELVEVLSGLRAGERVAVPVTSLGGR